MKVVAVETMVVGTPWRELTFVELVTDDGLRGVGEARMVNKTSTLLACIEELAQRYVLGMDPFDLERLAWQTQWAEYGRAGEVTQTALATLDVACYDLIGQATGEPVWRLLGGRFRDRVPAYANGWYQGDRDPEVVAGLASEVVARGYRGLKIDPFGAATAELGHDQLGLAVDIVAAVRDAVGPATELMVEMHGRFTAATAVRAARALERFGPAWIEEPVPPYNPAGLRQVRAGTWLPLATGERLHVLPEFRELFEGGLVDIVQADLTHFGGFTGLRQAGRLGRRLRPAAGPAQRLRPRRHRGQRAPGRRHRQLQGARALQRLRRPLGRRAGRGRALGRPGRRLLRPAVRARAGRPAGPRGGRPAPAHRRPLQPGGRGVGAT